MHFNGCFVQHTPWPTIHQSFFLEKELYHQQPKRVISGETINVLLWHPEEHTGTGSWFFSQKNPHNKIPKQNKAWTQSKPTKQAKIAQRKTKKYQKILQTLEHQKQGNFCGITNIPGISVLFRPDTQVYAKYELYITPDVRFKVWIKQLLRDKNQCRVFKCTASPLLLRHRGLEGALSPSQLLTS